MTRGRHLTLLLSMSPAKSYPRYDLAKKFVSKLYPEFDLATKDTAKLYFGYNLAMKVVWYGLAPDFRSQIIP